MSEAPSEEASLSDVFYVYLMLLRPRYFTNYVSFHEGLRPPPRGPCSFLDSVSQPIIAATNQLVIYPPFLGGYLLSNFIQPVYRLSRTPVSDETPFAGLSPAFSASQACRQLSLPYRLFANGLLLRLLGRNLSLVASDRHLDASLSRDLEDAKQSSSVLRGESRPPFFTAWGFVTFEAFRYSEDDPAYAGPSRHQSPAATPVQPGPSHPEDDPASAGPYGGRSCDSLRCCYACPARSFASRRWPCIRWSI